MKPIKQFKERLEYFIDPHFALDGGVVAVSEEVTTDLLFEAYSFGIFPWPDGADTSTLWFCPPMRGVLVFDELHVSQSLNKFRRNVVEWKLTKNQAFSDVIKNCARVRRPLQKGTWITNEMIEAYIDFHRQGYAHSVECWHRDRLIGGIYGVFVAGVFSAESMFYIEPNASKICFLHLIESLKKRGMRWIDIQMLTPHMETFGARSIKRQVYLKWLEQSKKEVSRFQLDGSL